MWFFRKKEIRPLVKKIGEDILGGVDWYVDYRNFVHKESNVVLRLPSGDIDSISVSYIKKENQHYNGSDLHHIKFNKDENKYLVKIMRNVIHAKERMEKQDRLQNAWNEFHKALGVWD